MHKSSRLVRSTVLLSILLASAIAPLSAVELYEEKKITQIQIEIDNPSGTPTDSKPVLSKLRTKEGDDFSQFTFDSDLKTLSEEYDRVQPSINVRDDQVFITIHLTPRPLIHQILFKGNERYSSATLQKELEVKPYTVFNRTEFNKSFNKLKEFYIKKGYFESQLSYSTTPIANSNEVDIQIDVREGKSGNIKKIVLNGFTKQERWELREMMYLKKYSLLTSWLTGNGMLRDEALEQDRMTIVNYLHNRGYADARVDIQILDDPTSDKIIIDISAERGQRYHFGAVHFEGNKLLSNDEIAERAFIRDGEVFSPDKIRETTQAIKDLYGQKGYIDANVQFETRLRESEPVFDVDFTIDEGEQYKIGMIHIFGNHSTKTNVILRESLLVPGKTFDSRKLKATQQRLEAMGYFKSVNVYAVRTADDVDLGESYRDVYIEVEETTTGNVSLFMGFSSTDSVNGGLDLAENNFNIAGIKDLFRGKLGSLRGGGQFFRIRATLGKKQSNYLLTWMNPYINDTKWRLGFELSYTASELQENTKVHTFGGSLFTNYPITSLWTAGLRQRARYLRDTISIETQKIYKKRNETHGFLPAISANLSYDSTDRAYKPHRGWRSNFEAELTEGGPYLFWKLSYINSLYYAPTPRGIFKLRVDLKTIGTYGGQDNYHVPYSERLFLGGEGTVRGYQPFIIGPRIPQFSRLNPPVEKNYSDTPQGGVSSMLLSLEYNYEVIRMLDAFVFFDGGAVSFDTWDFAPLRCAAGAGVRLEINRNTPITIGYGIPINPQHHRDRQNFFFSMSGNF